MYCVLAEDDDMKIDKGKLPAIKYVLAHIQTHGDETQWVWGDLSVTRP